MTKNDNNGTSTIDLYHKHMVGGELSESTIENRIVVLERLRDYLHGEYGISLTVGDVGNVKGYMLDTWHQSLNCTPASKNKYVETLKYYFGYLNNAGLTENNPSDVLKRIKIVANDDYYDEDRVRSYSVGDAVAMIELELDPSVDARDRAMVALLLAGGFRASELASLNVGTFRNMRNGRMYVKRKGGAMKWITVAEYAIEYLEKYLKQRPDAKDDEPLFLTTHGNRFNRQGIYKRMAVRQETLGLQTGAHILRHTFITEIDRHSSLSVAQRLAAHQSTRTTEGYVHPSNEELRAAANRLSWAEILKQGAGEE